MGVAGVCGAGLVDTPCVQTLKVPDAPRSHPVWLLRRAVDTASGLNLSFGMCTGTLPTGASVAARIPLVRDGFRPRSSVDRATAS